MQNWNLSRNTFQNERKETKKALGPHLGNEEMGLLLETTNLRALTKGIDVHHHWSRKYNVYTLLNAMRAQVLMEIKGWLLEARKIADSPLLEGIQINITCTLEITATTLRSAFNSLMKLRNSSNMTTLTNLSNVGGSRRIDESHLDQLNKHSKLSPKVTNPQLG